MTPAAQAQIVSAGAAVTIWIATYVRVQRRKNRGDYALSLLLRALVDNRPPRPGHR